MKERKKQEICFIVTKEYLSNVINQRTNYMDL